MTRPGEVLQLLVLRLLPITCGLAAIKLSGGPYTLALVTGMARTTVVLASDGRFLGSLKFDQIAPLGSRMRVRLARDRATL